MMRPELESIVYGRMVPRRIAARVQREAEAGAIERAVVEAAIRGRTEADTSKQRRRVEDDDHPRGAR